MRELTPAELLRLYESGFGESPLERAVGILAAACPEADREEIAAFSAGRRDELLLELRTLTFGSQAECIAECPECHSQLEFALNLADIRTEARADALAEPMAMDGFEIRLRLPDTHDLAAASVAETVAEARAVLLERCVVAGREGSLVPARELPAHVVAAISEEMERLDPQADVRLGVRCAACGYDWDATFDIVSFLWSEIQRAGRKLLHEVHVIASAYGWSEGEILNLSPWRRQAYAGMVTE